MKFPVGGVRRTSPDPGDAASPELSGGWSRIPREKGAGEMTDRLAGKVCLITGTGGTMGRATALAFAREGGLIVGCDVAIEAAEETVELVRDAGGEVVSLQPCVLSDPAECERLVEFATNHYG